MKTKTTITTTTERVKDDVTDSYATTKTETGSELISLSVGIEQSFGMHGTGFFRTPAARAVAAALLAAADELEGDKTKDGQP